MKLREDQIMWTDHIVEEIHATREKIANFYNNDMHAIFIAAQRGELGKGLIGKNAGAAQLPNVLPQTVQAPLRY
jgi:hypothetical protein